MPHAVVCKYSTFFKAQTSSLETCSTWTLNSANDWWLQNCKLGKEWVWENKIVLIGYTWIFVYESPRRYQGRMNTGPGQQHSTTAGGAPAFLQESQRVADKTVLRSLPYSAGWPTRVSDFSPRLQFLILHVSISPSTADDLLRQSSCSINVHQPKNCCPATRNPRRSNIRLGWEVSISDTFTEIPRISFQPHTNFS